MTTTTTKLTLYQWAGDLIVHRSPEAVRELLDGRGYDAVGFDRRAAADRRHLVKRETPCFQD